MPKYEISNFNQIKMRDNMLRRKKIKNLMHFNHF